MPRGGKDLHSPHPENSPADPDEAYVLKLKELLRQERLKQGLNFRQLSERTGISFGYLARAERSDNQPTVLVFRKWCRSLGLHFEDICQQVAKEFGVNSK